MSYSIIYEVVTSKLRKVIDGLKEIRNELIDKIYEETEVEVYFQGGITMEGNPEIERIVNELSNEISKVIMNKMRK
jgi:hypothetical protein